MHWEDERYVRLYTRDTATWIMAPWQARVILPLILRKLDRAGVMELGEDGLEALAALIVVPLEVVEGGMPYWLRKGTFELNDDKLVMPNYIDAQEAKASDKQRAREYRERNRDRARSSAVGDDELQHTSNSITARDSTSHDVTADNTPSHGVTPSLAVPSLAKPNQEKNAATNVASELFEHWLKHRKLAGIGKRGRDPVFDNKRRSKITSALKQFSAEDVKKALAGIFYSEFHTGDNKDKKLYCDIDNALRDASHIEQFRDLYDKHHPPMPPVYKPEPAPTDVCDPPEGLSDIFDK